MCTRIASWVPSSEPVSTITQNEIYGATASRTSCTMCASLRTIMFRQIDGPSGMRRIVPAGPGTVDPTNVRCRAIW